ncbi:MAG: hypothetical protein JSS49_22770 [Planctomycetes bacterium]|nr:hypothetical protein [Planctomycetota bacterium]
MANPPQWILKLANSVTSCLEPMEPMPPVGCHYHQFDSGWEISIFPAKTEIVGGPEDGQQIAARFQVDILAVTELFTHITEMTWQSRSFDEQDQLGAHIAIGGVIEGEQVWIRILKSAPSCFDPGRKAMFHHGRLVDTW